MIIQMTLQMSGGRYDDRQWPGPGINFEVPDLEGKGLVGCGAAVFVAKSPVVKPPAAAPAPPPPLPPPLAVLAPEPEPEPKSKPKPAAPELAQPSPTDPKLAWVAYAVSRGASRAEAEGETKAQLQAAYGGRLL